jgi:hypothetical protein
MIKLLEPILQLITALLKPLLDLINTILPPITKLINGIVDLFANKLIPQITKFVTNVVQKFATAFNTIKQHLDSFKAKFLDIFEKIRDGLKIPINAIISFINGLVGGVTSGLNAMIRALNKLSFDVPDWVPIIGGETFGFNLKELTAPQIPLLAQGAVIEPNKPFPAILGDQKTGTNIEAPLETIKQAVTEVLNSMALNVNINASPDTAQWFKAMQVEGEVYTRRTGLPSMS